MIKFTVFYTQFLMISFLSSSGLASAQVGGRFKKFILVVFGNK